MRVRGLALDISIEGAVRMCANVLTVPAILVSNSSQMQWCEKNWGLKKAKDAGGRESERLETFNF